MRYTSILLSILVFATVTSCQKTDSGRPSVALDSNDNTVDLSSAMEVAFNFATSDKSFLQTRSSEPAVKEAFSIKDTDGLPLFHVVNYEDGGFVLVAGDNRLMPVQAYSTKGKFSANKADYPFGLKVWMVGIQDSLKTIKVNSFEQDKETQAAWRKYSNDIKSLMATRSLDPGSGLPPEADTLVGPFITDSWHQEPPYNQSLDYCNHVYFHNNTNAGEYQPVVGCVPLAIARIMRYHEYPTSFSWSNMPDGIPQTSTTQSYLKNVHDAVKAYANSHSLEFTCYIDVNNPTKKATAVDRFFPIGSFMRSQYGYAAGMESTYSTSSYTAMKRELIDHSLPCIITGRSSYNPAFGSGHAWICSGYHYIFEHWLDNNNEPIGVETTYLYYCWGDTNITFDGWFTTNNVSLDGIAYQFYMSLSHHLSPVDYWDNLPDPIE